MQQEGKVQHAAAVQFEDMLPLILEHSDLKGRQEVVCVLLHLSKSIRTATSVLCSGQVLAQCYGPCVERASGFAWWLEQHAHLIGCLILEIDDEDTAAAAKTAKKISAALQHAAAAGQACQLSTQGLRLHSFVSYTPYACVLQQLPPTCLRHLNLAIDNNGREGEMATTLQQVAEALAPLTALQTLHLAGPEGDGSLGIDPLLPPLSAHTRLKTATLSRVQDILSLEHLPASLQHLSVYVKEGDLTVGGARRPLQLGHLTALTHLAGIGYSPLYFEAGDVLPPHLVHLKARYCECVQPLLGLKQLRELEVGCCVTPAAELRQLASLSALADVKLSFEDTEYAAEAATVWHLVPQLRSLVFDTSAEDGGTATLQHLAKATCLTYLKVDVQGSDFNGLAKQMGAALAKLTNLVHLELGEKSMLLLDAEGTGGEGNNGVQRQQDVAALMQAIACLPKLEKLQVSSLPLGHAAARLEAATQLTELSLCGHVSGLALGAIVCSLTGLRTLKLVDNPQATDALLPMIAQQLQLLTGLQLKGTAVTAAGARYLSRLQQLQWLCGLPLEVERKVLRKRRAG